MCRSLYCLSLFQYRIEWARVQPRNARRDPVAQPRSNAMIKPFLPLFASLTLGVVANGVAGQSSPPALSLQVYNADAASFHVNAVLVSGKTDAVLIDSGFTQADAYRIAAMVLDSRKTLK